MTEMATARVFMSGRSQAVRIPKSFWLDTKRVSIKRKGEALVIEPIPDEDQWASLKEVVGSFEGVDWEEMTEARGFPDAPRMGIDESPRHFERRMREYERMRRQEMKGGRDGR